MDIYNCNIQYSTYKQTNSKLFEHTFWDSDIRRSLWNVQQKLKSQKKYCTFFAWNLISMPRGISWHHWKNLLTSKRGHSGGSNFSTEFDQIWLKTSGGSRELIFGPICKCLTISESSWHTDFRFLKLKDLGGH